MLTKAWRALAGVRAISMEYQAWQDVTGSDGYASVEYDAHRQGHYQFCAGGPDRPAAQSSSRGSSAISPQCEQRQDTPW